ncbi:unnamed protein product [Heterobilharzia americana]|nr:unnamed protein product [Heterobilharzia americana]
MKHLTQKLNRMDISLITNSQALNGFIFIMSCDGEVFSVSRTVEHYLGFHQADILHQSVLELIHSEDREEFRKQLSWRSMLPTELQSSTLHDLMNPENAHFLKRQFTVRFRCLLDIHLDSLVTFFIFQTLELSGRLQFLHGQARSMQLAVNSGHINASNNANLMTKYNTSCSYSSGSTSNQHNLPPLGLFAVCSPLGPLPSLNGPQRDATFKTKHQLDLTVITIDARNEEGMELLIRRTDEYKLPFPLLEPETLLNGEELPVSNTNSQMDINLTFPVCQTKQFDHHLNGSNDKKLYGLNIKVDRKMNLGSKYATEKLSNFDVCGDSIALNLKRANSRHMTDTMTNCAQMERHPNRPPLESYGNNLHLSGVNSNLLEHCLNKPCRQPKVIQTMIRRRKRTVKETNPGEVNKCRLNHRGSCTTACLYMSSELTINQNDYGTGVHPSAYLPLGLNQAITRNGESLCGNPYLCWPANTNTTAASETLSPSRLDNFEQFSQCDSGKVGLFMINSQNSNQDLHEFSMQDHYPARNYPIAYDAYSAAVAAAAVVAAATNSCNQKQQNQTHHRLSLGHQYQSENTQDDQIKHFKRHDLHPSHISLIASEPQGQHLQQVVNNTNLFDSHQRRQSLMGYNSPLRNEGTVISSNLQSTFNNCADYILSNNYFSQEQAFTNQDTGRRDIESGNSYIKEFLKPGLSNPPHPHMNVDEIKRDILSVNNHHNSSTLSQPFSNYTSINQTHLFSEDFRGESIDEQKDSSSNMYLQHNVEQKLIYGNPVVDKESSSAYSSYSSPPNLTSPHNNDINIETDSGVSQKIHLQTQVSKMIGINRQFDDPVSNPLGTSECDQFYESSSNWTSNPLHANYKRTQDFLSDQRIAEGDCGNFLKASRVASTSLSMDSSNSSRSPTPRETCISRQDNVLVKSGTEHEVLYHRSNNRSEPWSCRVQPNENVKVNIQSYSVKDFNDHKKDLLNSHLEENKCSQYDSITIWDENRYDSLKSTAIPVPVVCSDPLSSISDESSHTLCSQHTDKS